MKINRQTLLFVSIVVVLVALGLTLSRGRSENPNAPITGEENKTNFEAMISDEGGVEVTVTPVDLSPDSPEWSFGVSLSTHSVELAEDMVAVSELFLDSGEIIKPISWEGSPPGGHHRSGVLKFSSASNHISGLTLKIKNVGGVPERNFTWSLK